MSFYNSASFDAKLVVAQICACFFLSTLSLSSVEWLIHQAFGTPMTLRDLYDHRALSLGTAQDVLLCAALVLNNGLLVGFILSVVVERAKKCLDFCVTLFVLHWLLCVWYAGVPTELLFYGLHLVATVIAAVSGEYLCMRKELAEISVSDFAARTSPPPPGRMNSSGQQGISLNPSRRQSSQRPSSPHSMVEDA